MIKNIKKEQENKENNISTEEESKKKGKDNDMTALS